MNCLEIRRLIEDQIPGTFRCGLEHDRISLLTPFTYPDGDTVEVYLLSRPEDRRFLITDLGETIRFLAGYGVAVDDSFRRDAMLKDICSGAKVRFKNGMLATTVNDPGEFLERLISFGQTVVRVADIVYTAKTATLVPFRDEVRDYVVDRGLRLLPQAFITERLDRIRLPHRPDFGVEHGNHITVVKTLSSYTRHNANDQVSKVVRLWDYMRSHTVVNQWDRVTVLNDATGVWDEDWVQQMKRHSRVYKWMEDRDQLDEQFSIAQ